MAKQVLRLVDGVNIEPQHDESTLDCRLLFMGDRYRQLLRTYPEVIYRLSRSKTLPEIRDFVNASAEIAQYYEVTATDEKVAVTLRDSIFREAVPHSTLDLHLRVGRRGDWSSYPLTIERLRVLGQLVPLLQGDWSPEEIAGRIETFEDDDRRWAKGLMELLAAEKFLEEGPEIENAYLKSPARPRTTFVAHTSILLQTATTAIVTDPLLRPSLRAPRAALDAVRLPLSAICLTHAHWDHCDVQSLLMFDKATPVVIPRVYKPTIFNPPMAPVLRLLGFSDIREADPWDRLQLGDVEMILVPFHGEQDEPGAEIDHYTYVFKTTGLSVYGGVDAFRDTFGEMPAALARVREEHRPTVAFLPISRMDIGRRRRSERLLPLRRHQDPHQVLSVHRGSERGRSVDSRTGCADGGAIRHLHLQPARHAGRSGGAADRTAVRGPRRPAVATAHAGRCRADGPRRVVARRAATARPSAVVRHRSESLTPGSQVEEEPCLPVRPTARFGRLDTAAHHH